MEIVDADLANKNVLHMVLSNLPTPPPSQVPPVYEVHYNVHMHVTSMKAIALCSHDAL